MFKPVLTLSLALLLATDASAAALVVDAPELTAQNVTIIGKMAESYKKYEEMIEKAQAQIEQLNKINTAMGNINSFLNSSAIAIANPMDLIDNLKATIEMMKSNAERLKTSIDNFSLADKVHSKRLKSQCPWLQYDLISPKSLKIFFTETGEETQLTKDAKALIDALSDDLYLNMQNTLGNLSGRALAVNLCETVLKEDMKRQAENYQLRERQALINGDIDTYQAYKLRRMKAELTARMYQEKEVRDKYEPLFKRNVQMLETLGVKDPSANTSDFTYCKEGKNKEGKFCYPQALEVERLNNEFAQLEKTLSSNLNSAGSDKEKQAQAYANFSQEADNLMLKYTKEIAYNLSFLNETMSLMGSLIADDYKRKYSDPSLTLYSSDAGSQATEQQLKEDLYKNKAFYDYSTTFDNNGFPKLNFTKN